MMKRTNLYLDEEQLGALHAIARAEGRSVADTVREAVDLLIHDRAAHPRRTLADRRAAMQAFISAYEGSGGEELGKLTEGQIDDLVTQANGRPEGFLDETAAAS